MTKRCYVCKVGNPQLTYHRFPSEPNVCKKWLLAFNLEEDDIFKNTLICSRHFSTKCYNETISGNIRLIKGSIPTQYLRRKSSKNCMVNKDVLPGNISQSFETVNKDVLAGNVSKSCEMVNNKDVLSGNVCESSEVLIENIRNSVETSSSPKIPDAVSRMMSDIEDSHIERSRTLLPANPVKETFTTSRRARRHYNNLKKKYVNQNSNKLYEMCLGCVALKQKMKAIQNTNLMLKKKVSSLNELVAHLESLKMPIVES